ncbi:hypothetical protein D1970_01780 [Mesobacillus zeae]|uniref:Uncharacterized protein n=1 Tax=Mesobacillus zeae TaxID=1917180 RepID=A0A398BM29_9BACI|nr:hypothetical protein D1970_01780 [Mesobacillus zeae]
MFSSFHYFVLGSIEIKNAHRPGMDNERMKQSLEDSTKFHISQKCEFGQYNGYTIVYQLDIFGVNTDFF